VAYLLFHLGGAVRAQGDVDAARACFEESLMIAREMGDRWTTAESATSLGLLAAASGDGEAARRLCREGLTILQQIGAKLPIAECLAGLAAALAAQGPLALAERLIAAAQTGRESIGAPLSPAAHADQERLLAVLRPALGEAAFAATWAEGQAMSLDEAVAVALEGLS
jgi:hypothetical protein